MTIEHQTLLAGQGQSSGCLRTQEFILILHKYILYHIVLVFSEYHKLNNFENISHPIAPPCEGLRGGHPLISENLSKYP